MTTVKHISHWLDAFAPPGLAEAWDNVGLLWGDPEAEVSRIMTCLTVTSHTASEAIDERAELIVSHHPVLFRAVKKVVASHPDNGMLWNLAKAGISILSPHTAFDNTDGGINDGLARRLGLVDVFPLRWFAPTGTFKLVVFTPESDRDAVLSAAFLAGGGRIGAYEQCSYSSLGRGTFFGKESTKPTVGRAGRPETVEELRIEVVCPPERLTEILLAVRSAHSYEEPAIDVYPLHFSPTTKGPGAGRVGSLLKPTMLGQFAAEVAECLGTPGLQYVGDPERPVRRVAVVCGAGDDFLSDAVNAGADVLLTGEARFHRTLEAEALEIGLIVAGHHATERPGVEDLAARLAAEFTGLLVWPSSREQDPLRPIRSREKRTPGEISPGVGSLSE